jgi:hypothetical protein
MFLKIFFYLFSFLFVHLFSEDNNNIIEKEENLDDRLLDDSFDIDEEDEDDMFYDQINENDLENNLSSKAIPPLNLISDEKLNESEEEEEEDEDEE